MVRTSTGGVSSIDVELSIDPAPSVDRAEPATGTHPLAPAISIDGDLPIDGEKSIDGLPIDVAASMVGRQLDRWNADCRGRGFERSATLFVDAEVSIDGLLYIDGEISIGGVFSVDAVVAIDMDSGREVELVAVITGIVTVSVVPGWIGRLDPSGVAASAALMPPAPGPMSITVGIPGGNDSTRWRGTAWRAGAFGLVCLSQVRQAVHPVDSVVGVSVHVRHGVTRCGVRVDRPKPVHPGSLLQLLCGRLGAPSGPTGQSVPASGGGEPTCQPLLGGCPLALSHSSSG
jgi:hypothetical protein